jgi:uncharacterized protein with von Willebrand factor type A (vWA) domain
MQVISPLRANAASHTGALANNVVHFVRLMRAAGVRAGTASTLNALAQVEAAGIERRADIRAALRSTLISRPEHRELFDIAFDLFWKDPQIQEKMLSALLPTVQGRGQTPPPPPPPQRLTDAFAPDAPRLDPKRLPNQQEEVNFDATLTFSASEKLQRMDFEQMNAAEWEAARKAAARLALPMRPLRTRRSVPSRQGRIDLRACLQQSRKTGGEIVGIERTQPGERPPKLVVLCDISGSMHRYTRMFLHFVHALANSTGANSRGGRPQKPEVFLFGTRLTHVTRHLRGQDVDVALARVAAAAPDWSGGTRIGACLHEFNLRWARRVLGYGVQVLLLTDGLDREDTTLLTKAADRLGRSCRNLIWLNPLLRYDGFEPRAAGVPALLPHVDTFVPVHNLNSIADLAKSLGGGKASVASTHTR